MNRGKAGVVVSMLALITACQQQSTPQQDTADQHYLRIVTLAPHLAEMVFAVGAGDSLVGVSAYSDYPPQVSALPLIGDAFTVDQEQLSILQPDLLLAWKSGMPAHTIDEFRGLGYRVEVIQTKSLAEIAQALERIGELAGERDAGLHAANAFRKGLANLQDEYGGEAIRVFYQVSSRPLYTVNGKHFIGELIAICGGVNIFSELGELAPGIDVEAVVALDPEVIMSGSDAGSDAFSEWQRWPHIAAIRDENLFQLSSSEIGRPTPRLLAAGRQMCAALNHARQKRASGLEPSRG